ncbi:hypothetical protein DEM26_18635 [Thioclava sp. NG1]|uniref:hypothetical protein n=1 Tax=unclassified Thioclava TaxID=2621713 RepID=UPI000B53B71F|nr:MULTISPECIES: hypothetical protein [unclassified Thioclava]OWY10296.1 hypothetical protein B6V72_17625 [Thioclava sp. F34-6]PWE48360.1 hypothetical protein DEM26_18635 [Thioclava sp. NG1]
MPADNGKIQIAQVLVEHLRAARFSLASLKLILAMLHHQDVQELWIREAIETPSLARTWIDGTRLRAIVGPRRENGATSLHRLVAEAKTTDLFDDIRLIERNRILAWQFSGLVQRFMADRLSDYYTLLDLAEIADCGSLEDLNYLIVLRHVFKGKAPKFQGPSSMNWSRLRGKHMASLTRIAKMTGVTLVVIESRDRQDYGLHHVECRVCHAQTTWWISAIRKYPAGAKVTLIDASGSRKIDPTTFDFSHLPGVVPSPPPRSQ